MASDLNFRRALRFSKETRPSNDDEVLRPDLPFCTPGCCEGECIVRTRVIERAPRSATQGAMLSALQDSDLRSRFYCWRGLEGDRYVCTIFSLDQESIIAEFLDVLVIGVARKGDAVRPLCLLSSQDFDTPKGHIVRNHARDMGCAEWHVYFNNDPERARALAALLRG